MTNSHDKFIQLNRTFHKIDHDADATDDVEFNWQFGRNNEYTWSDIIKEHRVVILSEAGAGKTQEIRNTSRKLRQNGKSAFFVRIEHVLQSFEDSFEEGSHEEFIKWCTSGEEGWLLLDSVDEARLGDPKDFERAIKQLGRNLAPVMQKAHIVITGRTTAWRPITDLLLCESCFPYSPPQVVEDESLSNEKTKFTTTQNTLVSSSNVGNFKLVALDDLHGTQVDDFLRGRNVQNIEAFRSAVERKDAWVLTTRPQDLNELVEFWESQHRIGSRLELMQASVSRRLEERDQDRAEARPISTEKLRSGVRLVAAATTLAQQSAIRVPDGSQNAKGIPIRDVLPDWDDLDCLTLLGRPIFDEGIYGTVRFHHRSVREYLTAEWLHSLLIDEGSRVKIENLFFRSQYGIEVIVPTMRSILPWLAILDERILKRIGKLAPEVIFEGGDPSQLPFDTRVCFLHLACEQLNNPAHGRVLTDFGAIQRFANPDLANEIKALLVKYAESDEVTGFLLRMIWCGEISDAVNEVKSFALTSKFNYTRISALRALAVVGSAADQLDVRKSLILSANSINRDWLAEFIKVLPQDDDSVIWLLEAIRITPAKREYEVDSLVTSLSHYATTLSEEQLHKLIPGLNALIQKPPYIESFGGKVSSHFSWLRQVAAESLLDLVLKKDKNVLQPEFLSLLNLLSISTSYGESDYSEVGTELEKQVRLWPELCHALFWDAVPKSRISMHDNNQSLTTFWQVGIFGGTYWIFNISDFDKICEDIANREFMEDKILALQLAYSLYRQNGRPQPKLRQLKRLALTSPTLATSLNLLLHPPPSGRSKFREQQAYWQKRARRFEIKDKENKRQSKIYLEDNLNELDGSTNPGEIKSSQHYLYQHMRSTDSGSTTWSEGRWELLIPEFGQEVARAFRNGVLKFWRHHRPKLLSDGAVQNNTPFAVVFGLTGLSIEAREEPNWINQFTSEDAEIATRFALNELNGFPAWLPTLFITYPNTVIDLVMQEVDFELKNQIGDQGSQYVLSDVSWQGNWMWERLAPILMIRLDKSFMNIPNLQYVLKIISGSSIENEVIAKLASEKLRVKEIGLSAPMWFAIWVGTDPVSAIPELGSKLEQIQSEEEQTLFAMQFLSALIGGRREGNVARLGYRTVDHIKSLYILMHKYIRENEDIDRANTGVYSPSLRDDAQDARNALFSLIQEIPGKGAYLALAEIAKIHPSEKSRPWMMLYAKNKATLDATSLPWSPKQVRDFHNTMERTPSNHKDLWYLAIDRLNNLKFDLEDGDSSNASIIQFVQETEVRKYIGNWCRERSGGRYSIPQEEELADAKRPDLRFHGMGFDGPVPAELKLAEKWTGPELFERLEVQLCGDYLRDIRSNHGIFLLVYSGERSSWQLPDGKSAESFDGLVDALQNHWCFLSSNFPNVEDIKVIGIDLTKRGIDTSTASRRRKLQKSHEGEQISR